MGHAHCVPWDKRELICTNLPDSRAAATWLEEQRRRIPESSAIARAIDYSLKRWPALVRYFDDPAVPIDNHHVERQIRPVALGRSNWLFAGSLRAGQCAAAVMSQIQSAKLNGHDPYAYLKDVLTRLPTHKASDIAELLPHRWTLGAPAVMAYSFKRLLGSRQRALEPGRGL